MTTAFEKTLASASFTAACAFGVASMLLSPEHDIASGALMAMAQFLLLTASILHIDYKLNIYGSANNTTRVKEQQPAQHSEEQPRVET